jgi:hypothetical protein
LKLITNHAFSHFPASGFQLKQSHPRLELLDQAVDFVHLAVYARPVVRLTPLHLDLLVGLALLLDSDFAA